MRKEAIEMLNKIEEKDVKKNGESSAFIEKTNYLVEKYRASLFFIFLQLMVILFLIFGYLSVKENTVVEVILPKIIKDTDYGKLKIGIGTSNKLYYKIMGSYIVDAIFNTNKIKIVEDSEILKKMIYPEVLKHYAKNVDSFKSFVIRNDAEVNYIELEENVKFNNNDEAIFTSKGRLSIKLGRYPQKNSICTTEIKMITKNYMLFVTSFVKTCEKEEMILKDGQDGK